MEDSDGWPSGHGERPRSPVPWGASDMLGVIALTGALILLLSVALGELGAVDRVPRGLQRLLLPLPLLLLGVLTIGWVHVRYRAVARLFGSRPAEGRDWVAGIGWGLATFFLVNVGVSLTLQIVGRATGAEVPQPQEALREMVVDARFLPWLILTAVLIAPFGEELFFRGMLLQGLRSYLSVWWSIGLSAMLFAAAHSLAEPGRGAALLIFALILPVGFCFGYLLEQRGTLLVPIVAHATFNGATLLILIIIGRAAPLAS